MKRCVVCLIEKYHPHVLSCTLTNSRGLFIDSASETSYKLDGYLSEATNESIKHKLLNIALCFIYTYIHEDG